MEEQDVLPPMVGRALIIAALALGLSAQQADAHGAVTIPKPREAIDGDTAPWNGKVPWPIPFGASSPSSGLRAHQLTELVRAQTIRTGARTRPPRQRVKIRAT